jgi:hypothetical protein
VTLLIVFVVLAATLAVLVVVRSNATLDNQQYEPAEDWTPLVPLLTLNRAEDGQWVWHRKGSPLRSAEDMRDLLHRYGDYASVALTLAGRDPYRLNSKNPVVVSVDAASPMRDVAFALERAAEGILLRVVVGTRQLVASWPDKAASPTAARGEGFVEIMLPEDESLGAPDTRERGSIHCRPLDDGWFDYQLALGGEVESIAGSRCNLAEIFPDSIAGRPGMRRAMLIRLIADKLEAAIKTKNSKIGVLNIYTTEPDKPLPWIAIEIFYSAARELNARRSAAGLNALEVGFTFMMQPDFWVSDSEKTK